MTSRALDLLTHADHQARDMLMNSHDTKPGFSAIPDWAHTMRAAASAWQAIPATVAWQTDSIAAGDPFAATAITATQIETDSTRLFTSARHGQYASGMNELLDQAASAARRELPATIGPTDAQQRQAVLVRASLLHIGYVATHAAASSVARQAVRLVRDQPDLGRQAELLGLRIRGVEQTLDAYLHQPFTPRQTTSEHHSLDQAVDRFLDAAYRAGPVRDAATCVVLADVGRSLAGHTARFAIRSAQHGYIPAAGVRDRMVPALQASVHEWEASRQFWSRMLAPTGRPADEVTAAGMGLQRTLRDPTIVEYPAITTSMTRMLTAGTELAVLNQRALTDPGRTAPAAVVAALTSEALAERPATVNPLQTWLSLARIDGPAPIVLPDIVRDRFIAQGQATLDAAVHARSAGHALTSHPGHNPLLQLHEGTARPGPRPPTEMPSPNRTNSVPAPRIG